MENIKQIYGRNIKMLRKEKGYTLQFLAQRVGITHQQLSRIENGGGTSSSTLERIATVLAVSVSTLTTDKEPVIQSTSEYKNFVHGNVCEQMIVNVILFLYPLYLQAFKHIRKNFYDTFTTPLLIFNLLRQCIMPFCTSAQIAAFPSLSHPL